jgi:uncharacterized FlgJ-related protein
MKKHLSLTCFVLAGLTALFVSACSSLRNNDPANNQQSEPAVIPALNTTRFSTAQLMASPVKVSIASVDELNALFDKLKYNRENWTKDNCEVPRITFSGVSDEWKERADKLPVPVKKELFFQLMTPLVLIANENIMHERNIIANNALNSNAVKQIALKYRLIENKQDKIDEKLREQLLQRVDILPPSLALAQAAEESGWATSRFAVEGNAFFGQWDFSGNGMKPLAQRKELGNYGVARFASPLASVEAYMLNINSNRAYKKLRILRAQLRAAQKKPTGYQLATTLNKYSERGQAYIDGLQAMIRYNKLAQMDQAYLADNQLIHITSN